jgi:hypothetical protein
MLGSGTKFKFLLPYSKVYHPLMFRNCLADMCDGNICLLISCVNQMTALLPYAYMSIM